MRLTQALCTKIRQAALKASMFGPIRAELATRIPLGGGPRDAITNLVDVDADTTDLFDTQLLVPGDIEDGRVPGTAVVQCWTYARTGTVREPDYELCDTVYVGIANKTVVAASCHFEAVQKAVKEAK